MSASSLSVSTVPVSVGASTDGSTAPSASGSLLVPGTISATMLCSSPPETMDTRESAGTTYPPSCSSSMLMRTPRPSMVKSRMRPMFTPFICTGSPLRMPPASWTTVDT